ncbi:hypothetical protein PILCRDRAFT_827593 [Piloderma croceum F 1598]|uniref:Amine oxidase domain-containing protein n=1 Tax=Piloderma croceum (strain F 1598) TaxID=765440 RepID=A0A0C3F5N3_PILCF|nr:hypothetical protein PILCRDRAFT_827593 [Piloderma croceum F 1598]
MKDRTGGGRLFTYDFENGGVNDYFDVGAMRFPDIPFMKPVFDLILRNPKSPIHGMLDVIPYVMNNLNNLNFYNGIIKTDGELNGNPPPLDPFNTGVNPPDTVSNMAKAAIGDFKTRLKTPPFAAGWEYLMQFDQFSTRDYIALVNPKYSDVLIDYMETFNTATNLYDEALTETVMDSLDFDYDDNVSWFCVQGGAGKIADAMASKLSQTIQYGKRVTAIAPVLNGSPNPESVNVTIAGEATPRNYTHVISTIPFSCLRMVDTTQCGFNWNFQTAIRALHYDSSVKVAIRFSTRWWEDSGLVNGPHLGGVSSTDRPTRTVVYPSYGINENTGASIIVSYTWAQDALRFGALAQGKGSETETVMLQTIIKDLADMHQVDYTTLWKSIVDYKVYNWYGHEYSAGPFALFGPGQFSNLYPEVTKPVGGLLHFAGEAASVHHAWVVGAFISAYRTVYEILLHQGFTGLIAKMVLIWGTPDEIDVSLLKQQVALGQHMKFVQPV